MAKTQDRGQLSFAATGGECSCLRCGVPCQVDPVAGSQAKMLKRADRQQGLCVNCAVHNWMRNTYPMNWMLAQAGPRGLALPHIQEEFAGLIKNTYKTADGPVPIADAHPDEISWHAIIANWDLPFPTPVQRTATNPVSQEELDRERDEGRRSDDGTFQLTEREKRAKELGEINHAAREAVDCLRKERDEDSSADRRDRD